ncbi:MAG: chorismate-binding protein [Aquiluna sp.]|nr:chorismate-binding protein [Aquiluna sp.]MCF8545527.1 chorismate-binding protein [Aquiluna sp.]
MTLRVVSRRTNTMAQIVPGSLIFNHNQNQLIGNGIALKISAKGPNRIEELSRAWKELCNKSDISDEVQLPGSGLVAFTSITFSSESGFESVLLIPSHLSVLRDGVMFETTIESEVTEVQRLAKAEGVFVSGDLDAKGFMGATKNAISIITSSELEKVVLSRDLVMPLIQKPDLTAPLERLSARYPNCWTYSVGQVFGASPELLLRSQKGEVSARVLAGTAGRGTDPDVDRAIATGLKDSHKNKHEHEYAVASMLNELGPFCESLEADPEPFSLALPDLWHLATDVRGRLKPSHSLLDVISKLHPTAAVAGTPRQMAQELIQELEPFDRGGYAGPVGWIAADGSGELAIALRGGLVEETASGYQIRAIAGCGIVAESDPEAELAETELKFRAVRYAFEN